jgi:hypothetical protein
MLHFRQFVIVVITASVASLGCKSSNPSPTTQAALTHQPTAVAQGGKPTTPPANSTTGSPADAPPVPGTAQALAQRATNYAQTVGPLLSQHPAPAPPPTHTEAADWPDPDSMQLTTRQFQPSGLNASGKSPANPSAPQPADQRAFAAASTKTDVHVVRQTPDTTAAAPSLPATDAQTAAFARRAREYPQDLSAQVDDQLLKLLKEESVPDLQSMAALAPEDRELLSAMMDSLSNFRNQLRQNNNMLFSSKISPLVDLGDRLKAQAELSVPTLTFVSGALAYGVYTPMSPARFIAGKAHTAGVYYEVENFSSQLNDNKMYETKLTQSIVLYTESSGLPVWSDRKVNLDDLAHRRRHDFFNAQNITLPVSLTIGRYLLKVTIEDQQAHRIAENTVPVEIVAQ